MRIARPARESAVGDLEDRSAEVAAVSAASSSESRDSCVEAKAETSNAAGGMIDVMCCRQSECCMQQPVQSRLSEETGSLQPKLGWVNEYRSGIVVVSTWSELGLLAKMTLLLEMIIQESGIP